VKPFDTFARSLRDSFGLREDLAGWIPIAIAVGVLVAVLWGVYQRRRRRRANQAGFARLAATRGLAPGDVQLLVRMAGQARVDVMHMATQVEVFERGTAPEVALHVPTLTVQEGSVLAGIRHLRRALGFETLPEHFPLHTTRELLPEVKVEVGRTAAMVVEVTEAFFAVRGQQPTSLAVGAQVSINVVHAPEARYQASCTLLGQDAVDNRKLYFSHDESPSRIQQRGAVRVLARGPVELKRAPKSAAQGGSAHAAAVAISAELCDISTGGLAVEAMTPLETGASLLVSFQFRREQYHDLPAILLGCHPLPSGRQRLRLKLHDVAPSDEQRLAAAVVRHSAKPTGTDDD
jgi:hypothetical protein